MAELVTLEGLSGCRKCGGGKSDANNITINVQGATATNNNASEAGRGGGRFARGAAQGLSPEITQPQNNDAGISKLTEVLKQILNANSRAQARPQGLSTEPPPQVIREIVQKPVFVPTIVEKIKQVFRPYAIPTERRTVDVRQTAQAIPTEKIVKEVTQVDRPRIIERIKNRWLVVRQNQPQPPNFP